jgi:hypothetical protein
MSRTLSPITRLAQGILKADITAQNVAAESGIAYQTLLAYARGEKDITPLHQARLQKYLAMDVASTPGADDSPTPVNDPPFQPVSFRGTVESPTGGGREPVLVIAAYSDVAWRLDVESGQPLTLAITDAHAGVTVGLSVTVLQVRSTLAATKLRLLIATRDKAKAVEMFGFLRTAYRRWPPHTEFIFTAGSSAHQGDDDRRADETDHEF